MLCKNCGTEVGNTKFCPNCGTPLIKDANQELNTQNTNVQNGFNPTYEYINTQPTPNATYSYGNPSQQMQQPASQSNMGIYAFMLSLVGLLCSCLSPLGILFDTAAIILGVIGLTKKRREVCAVTGIICGIFGIAIITATISGGSTDSDNVAIESTQPVVSAESHVDSSTDKSNDSQKKNTSKKKKSDSDQKKESTDPEKEFKKSCQKFNYKKIARNPDKYIGQNFKVTVQVYSISEGSLFTEAYMKAYTDDGSGIYFDNMIYLFDDQNENSKSYVNVLEDDIITVYGTFEGMEDSTNYLNGEKSKDIALHMKYAKLVKE